MSEFDTIIDTARKYDIPLAIPIRLKALNDTEFESGSRCYHRDICNNIVLEKDIYDRLINKTLKAVDLSSIFNEMSHAFYDQELEY